MGEITYQSIGIGEIRTVNNSPLVSVIIPVFNDRAGLVMCLSYLAEQTWPSSKLEVIAVDNGSTPPLDVNQDYPVPIRIITCPKAGAYSARNAGAMVAEGQILAFTDADCSPSSDWISSGVAGLRVGGDGCIIGGEVLFSRPCVRTGTALYQLATGFMQEENIQQKGFSATANLFCTKDQFVSVGPFDEELLSGGDREWCWRAARKGFTIFFEPRAIVHTPPRTRLSDAIRQTRRVAAGRASLGRHRTQNPEGLRRHKTFTQAIGWLLSLPDLSMWERVRVVSAAAILKITTSVENVRLRLGSAAERR